MKNEQITHLANALYGPDCETDSEALFCLLVAVAKAYEATVKSRGAMIQGLIENLEMDK